LVKVLTAKVDIDWKPSLFELLLTIAGSVSFMVKAVNLLSAIANDVPSAFGRR